MFSLLTRSRMRDIVHHDTVLSFVDGLSQEGITVNTECMPQYELVARAVRSRILHGDYDLKPFPGTRRLATEMGVGHMVARQAMQRLREQGLVVQSKGCYKPVKSLSGEGPKSSRLAFLRPAFSSPFWDICGQNLMLVADRLGIQIRQVDIVHWHDSVIFEALESFGSAVIVGPAEPIPASVAHRLARHSSRLFMIERDMTSYGIPSIMVFDRSSVSALIRHVKQLGHASLDCINCQPHSITLDQRLADWREIVAELGMEGRLIDEPVGSYSRVVEGSYRTMSALLDEKLALASALLFSTEEAAIGATRAMIERGLMPGKNISVCAISDLGFAKYLHPSLTSVGFPRIVELVEKCLQWVSRPDQPWKGSLLLKPDEPMLQVGESCAPVAKIPLKR